MLNLNEKLAALQSEQQLVLKNYKEADTVSKNCEIKLIELRGAIAALEDLMKQEQKEEVAEK